MFTCPSLWTFITLACGFVLSTGRRTISRVIQLGCFAEGKRHHSIFYRFFSRAVWLPNELGKRVFHLALELGLLPENMRIILTVDDTLCRKSGAHIWGGGMHHDALLSNYGRGKSLVKFHNWVIVCVCIRTPWNENRWMAVPIAFRLYRSKKRCPKEQYRKRTQLARDEELAQSFSLRWTQEEMHRNVKQYLGLEDPQNGWWRRPKGRRRNEKIPGLQPHKKRGEKAVTRTVPFILTIYALVVLWYFGNGSAREDVERARRLSPWYREKTEPSFSDMLAALRRQLWAERNFSAPSYEQGSSKINAALLEWLCAA